MDEPIYTLRLRRIDICNLSLACAIKWSRLKAEYDSEQISDDRKHELDVHIPQWKKLHDEVARQRNEQDEAYFAERYGSRAPGDATQEVIHEDVH